MKIFHNKVVVITGSTQGIGKRTAEILARNNAKVIINSRSEEKVKTVVDEMLKLGYDVLGTHGDISDFNYCLKMRDEVITKYGKIDFLINNAGVAASGTLDNTINGTFEQVTRINVFGSIYPTKVFLDDLSKSRGSILFISSLAGIVGLPGFIAYSSGKRAITSIAESLKNEIHGNGVSVGIHYPGFTENEITKTIIMGNGKEILLPKRENVKVAPLDKTVNGIIKQLKHRNFRSFTNYQGRLMFMMYHYLPKLTLLILRYNRKKIMSQNTHDK